MAKGVTIPLIVDPKGAVDGIGKVGNSAGGLSTALRGLGGVAAVGLAALGAAAIGAVAGLVNATKAAGEYAENVQLAASKTNLSTEAVQELQYAAKITGISFETMQTSMVKLTKSQGAAAAGTGAQAEAFAELGVAVVDANGDLRDSTVVYSEVIAALGKMENPTERNVLSLTLLGKSALDLNGLIDGTAGSLEALAAQAHDAGAVLSDELLTKLGNVDDAFDGLSAGADAAKNALGLVLMPVLQELGDAGTGLLGRFTNAILDANGDLSKAAPAIGAVVGDAVTLLVAQVPKLLEVGVEIVGSILKGIILQAPKLIEQALPVLINFVSGIISMLPMLVDAGVKILVAIVQGVAVALPTLIPQVVRTLITTIVGFFAPANLRAMLDAGLALITGLVEGLIAALPFIIEALPKIILSIVDYLVTSIPVLIDAGLNLFLALVDALPLIIEGIVQAIPKIITGIITAVIGALPQIIEAGIKLFIALIENLPLIIIEIVKAIPQIVMGIYNALTSKETLAQIAKAGGQLIMGLWNGIKDLGAWLWRQISGFFNHTIIDPIKKLFGIKSPSTLFAGFGTDMVLGLERGLTGSNNLAGIMSSLSSQVTDGFQGSLAATARATVSTAAGTAGAGTTIINVNGGLDSGPEIGRRVAESLRNYKAAGGRVAFS